MMVDDGYKPLPTLMGHQLYVQVPEATPTATNAGCSMGPSTALEQQGCGALLVFHGFSNGYSL